MGHRSLYSCAAFIGFGLLSVAACGSEDRNFANGAKADASAGEQFGCGSCEGTKYKECDAKGAFVATRECFPKECVTGRGCLTCTPGKDSCVGNEVHKCGDDGEPGALIEKCDAAAGLVCSGGKCKTPCEAAADKPSYLGCEFWAVDLDNEYSPGLLAFPPNDAAGAPWGVALSNPSETTAIVTIEKNDGALGAGLDVKSVTTLKVAPSSLEEVQLPTRDVDGTTNGKNNGPGTWLSSNAYRITSNVPIIVYQFNTLRHTFSNDASLLLPRAALGTEHRVVGWPAANPIETEFPADPDMPKQDAPMYDRSYVTIVGTQPGTKVRVIAGGDIAPGGPIKETKAGETIEIDLGPFDVLNLESTVPKMSFEDFSSFQKLTTMQRGLGELTGTVVSSNAPVVVFTGTERSIAFGDREKDAPPGWSSNSGENGCTTDHVEEQIVPATAIGRTYLVTRSPIRSAGWTEPDVVRFMGLAAPSTIKTNLPAPNDSFVLQPNEIKDVITKQDFTVEASEPVIVAQMLVAQCFSTANVGDSSLSLMPPVDQLRGEYVFLTPKSWQTNYAVFGIPDGATVKIDGNDLPGDCQTAPVGTLLGQSYTTKRCAVSEGVHRVTSDKPLSLMVYGFAPHGSYAYVGGADVKPIYVPPPLK